MKKYCLLFILLFLSIKLKAEDQIITSISKVDVFEKKFTFGYKAGVAVASLMNQGIFQGNKTAFSLGLVFNFPFSKILSIQSELLFSTKGTKNEMEYYSSFSKDIELNTTADLLYVDFPVLAKYSFGKNSFLAGAYISYNMLADMYVNELNISSDVLPIDYGLSAAYERFLSNSLAVEIRANYGLTKVNKNINLENFTGVLGIICYL